MSKEVMQQALEALEYYRSAEDVHGTPADYAIDAVRAELAKPAELLDQTSLRAVLGGIGNEVHNLACDHNRDEKLSNRLSEIAVNLWDVAKRVSAKPAPVAVPDKRVILPGDSVEDAYQAAGWNACREAMLAAAPQPPSPAVDVEAIRDALKYMRVWTVNEHWVKTIARAIGDKT